MLVLANVKLRLVDRIILLDFEQLLEPVQVLITLLKPLKNFSDTLSVTPQDVERASYPDRISSQPAHPLNSHTPRNAALPELHVKVRSRNQLQFASDRVLRQIDD